MGDHSMPADVLIGVGRGDATVVVDPERSRHSRHCGCLSLSRQRRSRRTDQTLPTWVGLQWHRSTLVELRTVERRREAGHNRAVATEFGRLAR